MAMNPNSKTYMVRCPVDKQVGLESKPVYVLNQDAERTINLNKAGNLIFYICRRFWQKSLRGEIHEVPLIESNKGSVASAGISSVIPAIFFKQLVENN